MPKINYTKYIILGLLSGGPMTGYEIRRWVKDMMSYVWDIGYGQYIPHYRRSSAMAWLLWRRGGPMAVVSEKCIA